MAFEPAAAAPIAAPAIHCSSIGHPGPEVRGSPKFAHEVEHFTGRKRRHRSRVFVVVDHVRIGPHLLSNGLELCVAVGFLRHSNVSVDLGRYEPFAVVELGGHCRPIRVGVLHPGLRPGVGARPSELDRRVNRLLYLGVDRHHFVLRRDVLRD